MNLLRILAAALYAIAALGIMTACEKSEGPKGKVVVDPHIGHDYPPHSPPTNEEIDNEADEDPI